jgi:cbb3-type cytochrome oxidase maturation protein
MTVLLLLIFASLALAGAFLGAFIWAVRSGQFEDTCTPSMRVLTEETHSRNHLELTEANEGNEAPHFRKGR